MSKAKTKKSKSVTPRKKPIFQTSEDLQYQEWLEFMNTIGVRGPGMIKERAYADWDNDW